MTNNEITATPLAPGSPLLIIRVDGRRAGGVRRSRRQSSSPRGGAEGPVEWVARGNDDRILGFHTTRKAAIAEVADVHLKALAAIAGGE